MVDTRCADPDLQLDVDIMILEYTLYQAVKAQFDFLSSSGCQDEAEAKAKAISSTRVLSIFDSFIYYFNATYPSHVKSTEFFNNLDILEFLGLLSSRSTASTIQFSDNMPEKFRQASSNNLAARRHWLAARERQARKLSKQPQPAYSSFAAAANVSIQDDVEDQICDAWNQHEHQHQHQLQHDSTTSLAASAPTTNENPPPPPLLFDLIPRFMDVSAEISALLGHHPNETWMHIAAQFMLQASLEALHARLLVRGDSDALLPRLDDCFAWGYVEPILLATDNPSSLDGCSLDEMVELVNELFCDPSDPATRDPSPSCPWASPSSSPSSLRENPNWTSIRTQYLSEFSIASDASAQSQTCRLDRLTTKYPPGEFQQQLTSFMRNIWDLFCNQLNAKPVLAQIEEDGHLKTLGICVEGAEFDDFLGRVGLHKNAAGILTLDHCLDDKPSASPEVRPQSRSQAQSQAQVRGGGFVSSGNAWRQSRLRPSI
ncbi:hypothetical protein PV05_01319 [Exophiala xenobiotica]|uniref:Uncharacterized protein n=1 Tax=Exophiala xenobiotica TaxID=348802 RepID=A0A0D2DFU3_9EURO|nr:uncharacterized protein PV05_01319 [Exophiala xenobiotica]KIW61162.1 hypothetical protein PV05_01319 [Exophiala xenobiotica]